MKLLRWIRVLGAVALGMGAAAGWAESGSDLRGCDATALPRVSFVQFSSPNIATSPPSLLTIKGKLSLPARHAAAGDARHGHEHDCSGGPQRKLPAVLILHGSSGVDARGDFHEAALNAAGIATLQIDMWEARGVASAAQRPKAPILTLPDAFSALAFLAARDEIDPDRIGVLGFSWGGVNTMAAAERLYVGMFGGGRQFKAHVAHYPVCYAYNNPIPGVPPPAQMGTQFLHLTGAPMLIQVGSLDGYDNGAAHCRTLARSVNAGNVNGVTVTEVRGAHHAFDRLMVPIVVNDPFGSEGSFFATGVVPPVTLAPDVAQAQAARERLVRFFRRNL